MRWRVTCGDILDEPADVLVCSANVFLNLSGGVGGAILLRYGDAMQRELHRMLSAEGKRYRQRGDLVVAPPCGTPYKAVLHAVAVDAFYQSSPEVVRELARASLSRAASLHARRVAFTALATGFGRMSMSAFATAVHPLVGLEWPPIEEVVICVRNATDLRELAGAMRPGLDQNR